MNHAVDISKFSPEVRASLEFQTTPEFALESQEPSAAPDVPAMIRDVTGWPGWSGNRLSVELECSAGHLSSAKHGRFNLADSKVARLVAIHAAGPVGAAPFGPDPDEPAEPIGEIPIGPAPVESAQAEDPHQPLPLAMRQARRWLVWKSIPNSDPTKKARKVPFYSAGSPRQGALDTDQDRARLTDYATAQAVLASGAYTGLGFALGPDADGNHWQGIDLDGTDERPNLAALAQRLPGYVERSPSGKGFHAIGLGRDFATLGSNASGIEAYSHGRYFTVTGAEGRGDLEDISAFVTGTLKQMHSPAREPQATPAERPQVVPRHDRAVMDLRSALASMRSDDRDLWVRMGHALKTMGDQGRALWMEWSQTSEKFDPSDAARVWESFSPEGTDHRAVFAEAQRSGWVNPAKTSRRPANESETPADAPPISGTETIEAAIEALQKDAGACVTDEAIAAWAILREGGRADYERLRAKAKKAGARVSEIDRLSKPSKSGKAQTYFDRNPSDPSDTRAESIRQPSGNHPNSDGLTPSCLLWETDDGEKKRLIDSLAAEVVGAALKDRLTWDSDAGTWLVWETTHWQALANPARAESMLADAVHIGTDPIGYRMAYLNGIAQIIQRRGLLRPNERPANVIPFANGLYDLQAKKLKAASPGFALDWALPHDYGQDADCPTIKAWLLRSVEGDSETVELLRAWLAALVRGIPLQYFLLLLGRGGSGKGTFQRLVTALIGALNVAVSSLRDLEENRFETAKLYGKRLCMVNEAGRHGGALNMLKAITGGDHIPLERKHQQQSGSFVFGGLVLMATNEDIQSTDSTSGLERRRITVRFPISATGAEKADWEARGGEVAVLHSEIPGLINWVLAMPVAEIRRRIDSPPSRVAADNRLGMAAGNSVADWLMKNTVPEPGAWAQIGVKHEGRDPSTGKTYFEHAAEWLYPNYLAWCLESGRTRPVALRKFRDTVSDMAETLGHPLQDGRHPVTRAASIRGLRLRRMDDPSDSDGCWMDVGGIEADPRMVRMDKGRNFSPRNSEKTNGPFAEVQL